MSVLPSSFASLRNLLELHLGDNAFEQFPEVICELRSLRTLWLNGNKLSSLPQSFANLRELRELDISRTASRSFLKWCASCRIWRSSRCRSTNWASCFWPSPSLLA
ncbi:MAG: leucine-rich repeat domain-containing protein [Saprospiraceae bacterium]|nr:leucine-rich repeat domain-containing protein [Candidatus Vicinibacter affinis]